MKKYQVFIKTDDGKVENFCCYADSKEHAEKRILASDKSYVKAQAFDWDFQFKIYAK